MLVPLGNSVGALLAHWYISSTAVRVPLAPLVPLVPFWTRICTAAHSPDVIVSVAPVLKAVAVLTHSGSVPAGTVVVQPFVRPDSAAVAKV